MHGNSDAPGTLTKNEHRFFNGSYNYRWDGPPYSGTISGCTTTKNKLFGKWFEDHAEYGWHVEIDMSLMLVTRGLPNIQMQTDVPKWRAADLGVGR